MEKTTFIEAASCPNHDGKECINMCLTRCINKDNQKDWFTDGETELKDFFETTK